MTESKNFLFLFFGYNETQHCCLIYVINGLWNMTYEKKRPDTSI